MIKEMLDLSGRAVLITGAAGHLGRSLAAALAELGAGLALTDRDEAPLAELSAALARRYGTPAMHCVAELADDAAVQALPGRVCERFGRLDAVVATAAFVGTSALGGWAVPFAEQSVETWRKALEVNLTSAFALAQAAAKPLAACGSGSLVLLGSIYGLLGPDLRLYEGTAMGNPAAYAASKGGLLQLTRWLATTLAPKVRVNAVTPGGIFRSQPEAFVERYVARTPLGRMGSERDMIGALVYLVSDLSLYVTGQNLVVDGGWSAW
jgi:NAD(P)-dependent dehydrogenase (short-subunit alcohol dehydrogenase family)